MKPVRIQRRRAKGWKMPANTAKVDRTTKWGNPCVVGKHGTKAECVQWHSLALKGMTVIKEKAFMDRFLKELVKDAGLAAYGEDSIRHNLEIV